MSDSPAEGDQHRQLVAQLDSMEARMVKIEGYSHATIVALLGDIEDVNRPGVVSRLQTVELHQVANTTRIEKIESELEQHRQSLIRWAILLLITFAGAILAFILSPFKST